MLRRPLFLWLKGRIWWIRTRSFFAIARPLLRAVHPGGTQLLPDYERLHCGRIDSIRSISRLYGGRRLPVRRNRHRLL